MRFSMSKMVWFWKKNRIWLNIDELLDMQHNQFSWMKEQVGLFIQCCNVVKEVLIFSPLTKEIRNRWKHWLMCKTKTLKALDGA